MPLCDLNKPSLRVTSFVLLWILDRVTSFNFNSDCSGVRQDVNSFKKQQLSSPSRRCAVPTLTGNVRCENNMYPWTNNEGRNKNAAFHSNQPYYVFHPSLPVHNDCWQELCPPSLKMSEMLSSLILAPFSGVNSDNASTRNSLDISMTWMPDENPQDVARSIIQECLSDDILARSNNNIDWKEKIIAPLEENLAESLYAYRDFCQTHVLRERSIISECTDVGDCNGCSSTGPLKQKLKCRLVATRGHSGAKCPQFHIDNVPCRWIQTMVGPGVELVDATNAEDDSDEVIRWSAFSNSPSHDIDDEDEDSEDDDIISWSVKDRNQMLVDLKRANIYRSKQGDAILIPGSSWDEFSVLSPSDATQPVVHKSPETLRNDQCRVLFTQDVVFE